MEEAHGKNGRVNFNKIMRLNMRQFYFRYKSIFRFFHDESKVSEDEQRLVEIIGCAESQLADHLDYRKLLFDIYNMKQNIKLLGQRLDVKFKPRDFIGHINVDLSHKKHRGKSQGSSSHLEHHADLTSKTSQNLSSELATSGLKAANNARQDSRVSFNAGIDLEGSVSHLPILKQDEHQGRSLA